MKPFHLPIVQPPHATRGTHATRTIRQLLALTLAAVVGVPFSAAPSPVAAAGAPEPTSTPARHRHIERDAPIARADGQTPSIHYQQALDHEADALEFEPGGRVTVPFTPRRGDDWEVDGRAPRALPAGHATGLQMRAAPKDAIWAVGPPADLAHPDGAAPASSRAESTDSTVVLASTTSTAGDATIAAAPIGASGLRREVFGFLPYWEIGDSTTILDWKTLSTVAYFSVGCTSSGALDKYDADGSTTTGWGGWTSSKMTSIINAAHTNQTRVVLTISCFAWSSGGASRQASLLGSAAARSTLAKAAAAAVRDRGADGINLDFEPIVSGYAAEFTALVRSVRSELNKVAPGYQLTFDTLGSIGNQPIAEATAPGGADAVFIMGYDYRTDSSSVAGSISPLTGPRYDLTDTIKAYTAKISPSKIILGVPYYGRAWSTASDALNASTLSPSKYGYPATPTYVQALDLVAAHGRRYDSVEEAPWTAYRKQTCTSTYGCVTSWRELYYDDAASLKLRYDLVNRKSLRGAGIWALGYDGTRPELRQALADKFLSDNTPPVAGVATFAQQQRDEGFRVAWTAWDDSPITGYDVQVSIDGGAWSAWLTGTTLTSSIFLGTDGRTYAFRVRGTDVHGNVSAWNAAASAAVTDVPDAIAVGGFASVLIDGLRMRSGPSTDATIMTTLTAGDALQVIGGPATGDGYTWFQVAGPVRQWGPVDPMQVGGWVAAFGNGETNAGPRRPVYATLLNAGITGLTLNDGGERVVTPDSDGTQDKLHLSWTNEVALDDLALRVHRTDGTFVGSVALGGTGAGGHGYDWNGRIDGSVLPTGTYVVQLQGAKGSTTYSAPSASPVSPTQIARFGVVIGPAAPTSILSFTSTPVSPTASAAISYNLTFGGPVAGLTTSDLARTGTATGCTIGPLSGSGVVWTFALTGCSQGTVSLALKANSVMDAVSNIGPAAQVNANLLVIDRAAPTVTTPRTTLRTGVSLASTSTTTGLLANLSWIGTDPGGAGIATYDIARSRDGDPFVALAAGVPTASLLLSLAPGHTYRFRVRARDRAGNVGAWVAGPTISAYLPQDTSAAIGWKGSWHAGTSAHYCGGSVRFATAAGASTSHSFTGRAIAWVTTFGADRGVAKVYLDGSLVATIDTYADVTAFRRVAFAKTWSSSGFHTLRIVVVGTAGRPRVDLDAFEVLR